MQYMVFSKHLMGLPLAEIGARLRDIGISAIDLAVRPGGHIEPERVRDDLPHAAEILAAQDVSIGLITTNITRADELHTRSTLETAAALGIGFYKLGYYAYQGFGTLRAQRSEVAICLRDLAMLNREIGIGGGFHNHSADSFGAAVGDIETVLADIAPADIGWYCDPTHACIEGGSAGWLMALDALQDRLKMLAVKDFRWIEGKRGYAGARRHSVCFCPLQEGNVPWPEVLSILHSLRFDGPVSFHGEYIDEASEDSPPPLEVLSLLARDVAQFDEWRKQAQS